MGSSAQEEEGACQKRGQVGRYKWLPAVMTRSTYFRYTPDGRKQKDCQRELPVPRGGMIQMIVWRSRKASVGGVEPQRNSPKLLP